MPGSSGTLTVPADKDDEWADDLWLEAFGRFDAWIDGVMSELRAGLHSAPDNDVRPSDAPGGEWVRVSSLRRRLTRAAPAHPGWAAGLQSGR